MLFDAYVMLFFVSAVVAAACDFLGASAGIDAGEGAFWMQLDGTAVSVVAQCCLVPLLLLL